MDIKEREGISKMILADKIIEERKRSGWSQEELAEKLGVSRQSISKWEGAQSIPDINRIIQMAEIFGVSTDYLLKDKAKRENKELEISAETVDNLRCVSMEEANDFLKTQEKFASLVALGVSLYIASPFLLLVLEGLASDNILRVSSGMAMSIGIATLLCMVAIGVCLFILSSLKTNKYLYLNTEIIDTAYGVDGMVKEKREQFSRAANKDTALGVALCILSSVPLLISIFTTEKDYIIMSMIGMILVLVACGVNRLVRVAIIQSSYEKLLQDGNYAPEKKKISPTMNTIASIYWSITTAIYLACSFFTMAWSLTWIIWPVAAVLYGAIEAVARLILSKNNIR
ncbi:MAG: helix-turn-helix domain-containing protein [Anaerorhabdus sp.]